MAFALTLRYASFRHKNRGAGRSIELITIIMAMMALDVLLTTNNIQYTVAALAVVIACVGLFWFFKRSDEMRRTMPD